MRCLFVHIFLISLAQLTVTGVAFGDAVTQQRLDEINKDVDQESGRLDAVQRRQAGLKSELEKIRGEMEVLSAEEAAATRNLGKISTALKQAQKEQGRLSEEIDLLRVRSGKRIRALYMHRPAELLESFFVSTGTENLGKHAYFVSKIRGFDKQLMEQMAALSEDFRSKEQESKVLYEDHLRVKKEVASKQKSLKERSEKKAKRLKELDIEQGKLESLLTSLRAQALRLETVVASLTSGDGATTLVKARDNRKDSTLIVEDSKPNKTFKGDGLKGKKKKLLVPVKGELLQKFGKQKLAEFKDFVFRKGLEFAAETGAEVVAIEHARVLFRGRMPGYGTVLILDHGERYYSLYGRLSKLRVKLGEVVERGQEIATAGDPNGEQSNFYFEIRHNGSPVNPQNFFHKKFKIRASKRT